MAQFPDVYKAVNAVQEILNSPQGPRIRQSDFLISVNQVSNQFHRMYRTIG